MKVVNCREEEGKTLITYRTGLRLQNSIQNSAPAVLRAESTTAAFMKYLLCPQYKCGVCRIFDRGCGGGNSVKGIYLSSACDSVRLTPLQYWSNEVETNLSALQKSLNVQVHIVTQGK